jgi:hypothetical protein
MRVPDYSKRILALAEVLHRWIGQLMKLDGIRREKFARYAEEIAATLARAAEAHHLLEAEPVNGPAQRALVRDLDGYRDILRRLSACCNAILTGASSLALKGGSNSCARPRRVLLIRSCFQPIGTTRPSIG